MTSKKEQSLEYYMQLGAEYRIVKSLMARLVVETSKSFTVNEKGKIKRALDYVNECCSKAEDNMYSVFPNLGHDYCCVFYGDYTVKSRNEVDEKMLALMAKYVCDILEEIKTEN
jgi:hypothetical protein